MRRAQGAGERAEGRRELLSPIMWFLIDWQGQKIPLNEVSVRQL